MSVHPLIKSLKASLIVSVQAYPGEPLRTRRCRVPAS